jgi:hypothetical protein
MILTEIKSPFNLPFTKGQEKGPPLLLANFNPTRMLCPGLMRFLIPHDHFGFPECV